MLPEDVSLLDIAAPPDTRLAPDVVPLSELVAPSADARTSDAIR